VHSLTETSCLCDSLLSDSSLMRDMSFRMSIAYSVEENRAFTSLDSEERANTKVPRRAKVIQRRKRLISSCLHSRKTAAPAPSVVPAVLLSDSISISCKSAANPLSRPQSRKSHELLHDSKYAMSRSDTIHTLRAYKTAAPPIPMQVIRLHTLPTRRCSTVLCRLLDKEMASSPHKGKKALTHTAATSKSDGSHVVCSHSDLATEHP